MVEGFHCEAFRLWKGKKGLVGFQGIQAFYTLNPDSPM